MSTRMSTYQRMDRARDNHAITRTVNGARKRKANAARDKRMAVLVQNGAYPYTPAVQSWASIKAGKPFSQLTPTDVKALVAK